MANKKITDLTELTAPATDDYLEIVDTSAAKSKKISRENLAGWHFLTTPLTSTSWDGDSFSTTSKTLIDLSVVFGVPAGVKAILAQIMARDSGSSSSSTAYFGLSPNNEASSLSLINTTRYIQNDMIVYNTAIVPCTSTGDVYYQVDATDTGTMDCWIRIWGYWL